MKPRVKYEKNTTSYRSGLGALSPAIDWLVPILGTIPEKRRTCQTNLFAIQGKFIKKYDIETLTLCNFFSWIFFSCEWLK